MREETFAETRERIRAYYGRPPRERSLVLSVDSTRDNLNAALRTEHEGKSAWVRDFHDGWVIYELEWTVGEEWKTELWKRTYTAAKDGSITLGDDAEQVEAVRTTVYRPVRAFLTEVDGKTILTAPATAVLEKAMTDHPHVLWMKGRFVGAEKANRNGALWTTGDLELGEPTVKYGPLNWLHEERHIIGAIAESALVKPTAVEAASDGSTDPYIAASSVVWKWLWPEESAIIERAAEMQSLWYSMECISERVICGDSECGGAYPYMDVIRASEDVCSHVKLKTATRRFENPTFLGGAAIVPPVRPGWADANAELMRAAASHAERAFEQTGMRHEDVRAGEWERLMASVIRYARG
jgi:hypothetical protein